jgi:hypothetical protein
MPRKRKGEPEAPTWVTDGWYTNDPVAQRMAVERFRQPVTTPGERAAAKAYVADSSSTFACALCSKYHFPQPTICYWCSKTL